MIRLWKAYQYLFYKYSHWDRYSWRNKNMFGACQAGLYTLTFLIGMNFFTFLAIIQIFTGFGFDQISDSKIKMLSVGIFFLVLNYFILIHNKKYKAVFKQFENEDRKSRMIGNVFACSYVILTFSAAIISGILLGNLHPVKTTGIINAELSANQNLN